MAMGMLLNSLSPEHMMLLMVLAVQWALDLGEEVMIKINSS